MPRKQSNRDPYDLRPALARITHAIEWNLGRTPKDKTLFVGFGEDHNNPTHPMLQRMLIQWLQRQGYPIAFGYEASMQTYSAILVNRYGLDAAKHLQAQLEQTDPIGKRELTASLSWGTDENTSSPFTSDNLLIHCLLTGVNTRFNDAARIKVIKDDKTIYYAVDPEHPETVAGFGDIDSDRLSDIREPWGMHMRNSIMVSRSIKHAVRANARVYLFHTGTHHLEGGDCRGKPIPHEHGMLAKYKAAGEHAIAILPAVEDYNVRHLPPEGQLAVRENTIIPIDGLPQVEFTGYSEEGAEEAYLNRLNKASGYPVDVHDVEKWYLHCSQIIRAQGPQWIEEARLSALTPL